jgi:hypothetical protein
VTDSTIEIPGFLQVRNRTPLTAEQQAKLDSIRPPKQELSEFERARLADKQARALERHNRGYEARRKFEQLPAEERTLRKARARLRKVRRKS